MTASDSDTVNTRPRRKKNFVGAPASGTAPAASSSTPSILTSAEVNASVSPARSWASYSEDEDDFPNEGSQARPVLGREARDRNSAVREAQEEQEPSYTDCMDTINATIAKVKNKANRTLNNGEEQAIFSAFQHMNKLYIRVLEENRKLRKRIDDHRCEQGGHPGPTRVVERMAPLPKPTYREALQGVASNTEKMADQPVVYISMTEEEDKTGKIKEIKTHIAGSKVEKIFSTKKGVAIRCHSDEDAGAVITSLQTKGLQGNRKPPLLPEVWLSYGTEDIRENGELLPLVTQHAPHLLPSEWKALRTSARGVAIRVPLVARDALIKEGLFLPGCHYKAKDSPFLRICFQCGLNHSGECSRREPCCARCGRKHPLHECRNHPTLAPDEHKCSLCGKQGHNALEGFNSPAACPKKLNLIKIKLAKTRLGPSSPPWLF